MTKRMGLFAAALLWAAMLPALTGYLYQGTLRRSDNTALAPDQLKPTVTFRLYPTAEAADWVWSQTLPVVCDKNGSFSVLLGPEGDTPKSGGGTWVKNIEVVLNSSQDMYWLGLSVNGGAEIRPRQQLLSVPRVRHAAVAEKAYGDFPIDGSASAEILKADAIRTKVLKSAQEPIALKAGTLAVGKSMRVGGDAEAAGGHFTYGIRAEGGFYGYGVALPGMVMPWMPLSSDERPPEGWVFCDGRRYDTILWHGEPFVAPNLNGRFPVGYAGPESSYAQVGATGGADKVALTLEQLPAHTHTLAPLTRSSTNNYKWSDVGDGGDIWVGSGNDKSFRSESAGGDSSGAARPHENRPPFRAFYFIVRLPETETKEARP